MLTSQPGPLLSVVFRTLSIWTAPQGASVLRRIVRFVQLAVIVAMGPYLALVTVPITRNWLSNLGWFDATSIVGLCALTIVMCIAAQDDLLKRMGYAQELTEQLVQQGTQTRIFNNGVLEVYPPLLTAIEQAERAGHRTLTVLGLTLYSAWPSCVRPWLEKETTKGWTIDLYVLAADFVEAAPELPPEWAEHARLMTRQILRYKHENAEDLRRRNIDLRLHSYGSFPALHGFRIDGALFIAMSQWKGIALDEPYQFYDYFPSGDSSPRARAYRQLFDNWVRHADGSNRPSRAKDAAAVA